MSEEERVERLIENFRSRAKELRALAEKMEDQDNQWLLRQLADEYDWIANRRERNLRKQSD